MRLIHDDLIPHLPRLLLLHMHRTCCSIRGRSWAGHKGTALYIYRHSWDYLYLYHVKILDEMESRSYKPDPNWRNRLYRGKNATQLDPKWYPVLELDVSQYPEHTAEYYQKCVTAIIQKLTAGGKQYTLSDVTLFACRPI